MLAVFPAGVVGGAEKWLLDLLAATDRLDVRVVCLAPGAVVERLTDLGLPTTVLPTGPRAIDGLRPAMALRTLLRRERPDVLLANGVKAAALALPVAALVGVPAVWVKHDLSYDDVLAGPLARLATRVVATDSQVGAATRRDDLVVVVPAAPAPPVPRAQARAELGLTGKALVLAVVGRLVDYKGVDDAILALLRPESDGWTVLVVGEDDPAAPGERARLEALTAAQGLQARVRFAGAVPDAGRRLSGVDALGVLTKPVDGRSPGAEGFGITALEAAAAGVPVIAIAGSPPALRMAASAGVAVPPGDPDAVAAALGQLSSRTVRSAMGRAARALSADHPTAHDCASRLVQVLAEAAGRPGIGLPRPPVSVVVTVRNERDALPRLLPLLTAQLGAHDELLIVDAGSDDGTIEILEQAASDDPRITVQVRPGAGRSEGRNLGIRAATWPVVVCTDAGCTPASGWLDALSRAFAEPEPASLVTGVYRVTVDSGRRWEQALAAVGYPCPSEARRPTLSVRAYGRLFGRRFDPTLPTGRSMAFTQSSFEAAGGFPEHLAIDDATFGRDLVAAGGRAVLAVDAEVDWVQRTTLRENLRMYRSYGEGDGLSGSRLLVGRDLARAVAYPVGLALLTRRSRASRAAALAGAAAYLSLPAARVAEHAPGALPMVPVVAALRDLAKAWGCVDGLRARWRR